LLAGLLTLGTLGGCLHYAPKTAPKPTRAATPKPFFDERLRGTIEARLAGARALTDGAVVVGVYRDGETALFRGGAPADGGTLFKVCSVTKVFTGVLLADAVLAKRVALDDEAQAHFAHLKLPRHAEGAIKVEHLATYSAGFPWQPTNFASK